MYFFHVQSVQLPTTTGKSHVGDSINNLGYWRIYISIYFSDGLLDFTYYCFYSTYPQLNVQNYKILQYIRYMSWYFRLLYFLNVIFHSKLLIKFQSIRSTFKTLYNIKASFLYVKCYRQIWTIFLLVYPPDESIQKCSSIQTLG